MNPRQMAKVKSEKHEQKQRNTHTHTQPKHTKENKVPDTHTHTHTYTAKTYQRKQSTRVTWQAKKSKNGINQLKTKLTKTESKTKAEVQMRTKEN